MGDAAGQLAERFELLRFVQLGHGGFALGGPLLDALLEVGGQRVQFLEPRPRFILAPAAPQRGFRQADEGRRMKWPLEERHVSEDVEIAAGVRVALEAAAAPGQKDKREVRPQRTDRRINDEHAEPDVVRNNLVPGDSAP